MIEEKVKKIAEDGICTSEPCGEVWIYDEAIQRICQLFPKSPDNPDGEEEAKDIDCQAECIHYKECLPFVNPMLCTMREPKPDEGRLLTDEEIYQKFSWLHELCLEEWTKDGGSEMFNDLRNIAKAQRDLTASIKDAEFAQKYKEWEEATLRAEVAIIEHYKAECQARVEEAWIEGIKSSLGLTKSERVGCLFKHNGVSLADEMFKGWQALKKKEGVK